MSDIEIDIHKNGELCKFCIYRKPREPNDICTNPCLRCPQVVLLQEYEKFYRDDERNRMKEMLDSLKITMKDMENLKENSYSEVVNFIINKAIGIIHGKIRNEKNGNRAGIPICSICGKPALGTCPDGTTPCCEECTDYDKRRRDKERNERETG